MENDIFIQRLQNSAAYKSNAQVRQVAEPILEQIRNLSRLPHPPAVEKKELLGLLGILQQKLSGVLIPSTRSGLSMEKAREIMGKDRFFGMEEVKNAFGIELSETEVPDLPPLSEMERHAKLGHRLRLRVNKAPDGQPLTMQKMQELLQDKFTEDEAGEILCDTSWYESEDFFTKETPDLSWAFTSDELLPDSTDKNYLQQTELIAAYVTDTLFKGQPLPPAYQEALDEFKSQKGDIARLVDSDWSKAAKKLAALKLNGLMRHTPAEALYDFLQTYRNVGHEERILENDYTWTNKLTSVGLLVDFGCCDSDGAFVSYGRPGGSDGILGVALSRRFP